MMFWYRAQDAVRDKDRAQLHCVLSGLTTVVVRSSGFLEWPGPSKVSAQQELPTLKDSLQAAFTDDNNRG